MAIYRGIACTSSLLLLATSGCTTVHTFRAGEPVRAGSAEPASADSFGGLVEKTTDVECPTNLMVEVRVKRGFFNSLLGVLTLGAYQRTDIDYICGKNPDDDPPDLGDRVPQPVGGAAE